MGILDPTPSASKINFRDWAVHHPKVRAHKEGAVVQTWCHTPVHTALRGAKDEEFIPQW